MSCTLESKDLRAVVKNTFVHFERVENTPIRRRSRSSPRKRRCIDAVDPRPSSQPCKFFENEATSTAEDESVENDSPLCTEVDAASNLDIGSFRAVVKNTFVHFERVDDDAPLRRRSRRHLTDILHVRDGDVQSHESDSPRKRKFSDASDVQSSSQYCNFESKNASSDEYVAIENEHPLAVEVNITTDLDVGSVRAVIKKTFLHFERSDEDCSKIGLVRRQSRRHLTDMLHARDADAQSYKVAKPEFLPYESGEHATSPRTPCNCEDTMQHSSAESSSNSTDTQNVGSIACNTSAIMQSAGSAGHFQGLCRPCVWFWRPGSCNMGIDCKYCHLCDEDALARTADMRKAIKKQKKKYTRARRQ